MNREQVIECARYCKLDACCGECKWRISPPIVCMTSLIKDMLKYVEAWDEVLNQLNNETEECEYYRDVWGAIGLEKAIRIIERKLKEVEECF